MYHVNFCWTAREFFDLKLVYDIFCPSSFRPAATYIEMSQLVHDAVQGFQSPAIRSDSVECADTQLVEIHLTGVHVVTHIHTGRQTPQNMSVSI